MGLHDGSLIFLKIQATSPLTDGPGKPVDITIELRALVTHQIALQSQHLWVINTIGTDPNSHGVV